MILTKGQVSPALATPDVAKQRAGLTVGVAGNKMAHPPRTWRR